MSLPGLLDDSAFLRPEQGQVLHFPIVVVGGSTAAYAAALGALQAGATVCIAQPQKVLGGQFTAQALPASDDAPLMAPKALIPAARQDPHQLENGEFFCISRAQRQFRDRQRQLQPVAERVIHNPGGSWVSHFSVTPVTAAIALNQGIEPYLKAGQLTIIPWAEPIQVLMQDREGDYRRVTGVVLQDRHNGSQFTVNGDFMIEATDLGDLLELSQIESRVGQESRSETGEAILPDEPQPLCQQAFTFCAVVEKSLSSSPIAAPLGYGTKAWLDPQEFPSTFWVNGQGRAFFDSMGMFRYRRLQRSVEDSEVHAQDVSVMNWGTSPLGPDAPLGCGNDYRFGAVLTGVSRKDRQQTAARGRDRTQAYLHFLQATAAPNLTPRGDLTWTTDGIALEPYIREARRGVALTTIRHEDVAEKFFPRAARARCFEDAVGIGQYHYLDFHPNEAPGHVDLGTGGHRSLPFSIPLGALIPIRTDGLVLSAKSIGTTHITNAAYRMHPVEWAIGEAGGHLAAFALRQGVQVRQVASNRRLRRQFQGQLARFGIPLFWFNDVSHEDPDFEAIQVLAAVGLVPTGREHLNFRPQATVSRAVAAIALANVLGLERVKSAHPAFVDVPTDHFAYPSIEALFSVDLVRGIGRKRFAPERALTREQLAILISKSLPTGKDKPMIDLPQDRKPLSRRELSRIFYRLLKLTSSQPQREGDS